MAKHANIKGARVPKGRGITRRSGQAVAPTTKTPGQGAKRSSIVGTPGKRANYDDSSRTSGPLKKR